MKKILVLGGGQVLNSAIFSLSNEFIIDVITDGKLYVLGDNINQLNYNTDVNLEDVLDNRYCCVVCAGYHKIISENTLSKLSFINIHGSILPRYRGLHSSVWAILNGEKELGATIHLINQFIDDGDILETFIMQYNNQTGSEVIDSINEYIRLNLCRVVLSYLSGELKPIKQDKKLASWVPRRNLLDCKINFNEMDIKFLQRFFLALSPPYPLPYIEVKNKKYEVCSVDFISNDYYCTVGRVINIENEFVMIKITGGIMVVKELLFEHEKIIPSSVLKFGMRLI